MSGAVRVDLLGTAVNAETFSGACEFLSTLVSNRRSGYVSCANAYSLSLASGDAAYQACLNGASFVTSDGMPVVWLLHALGYKHAERVHNDDIFFALAERMTHWRHYFVGGREGQIEAACAGIRKRFPELQIVGASSTPQRPVPAAYSAGIVEAIRASDADLVWVGMGTPWQDFWMREVAPGVHVPMIACGSLFDLLSGQTLPAPDWMKRAGLQWLFRLMQEPRRLFARYLFHNSHFAIRALLQWLRASLS